MAKEIILSTAQKVGPFLQTYVELKNALKSS